MIEIIIINWCSSSLTSPPPRHHPGKSGGIRNFPMENVLTAYPPPKRYPREGVGRFLGFYKPPPDQRRRGPSDSAAVVVIWGKDPKYYTAQVLKLLAHLSSLPSVTLHSTVSSSLAGLPSSVVTHGHLQESEWMALLHGATHVLGLGDPLLGPTGLDAIYSGCVLINPSYKKPKRGWMSQQGYIEEYVDERYSCTVNLADFEAVEVCIKEKRVDAGHVPKEYMKNEYRQRVNDIFGPFLGG